MAIFAKNAPDYIEVLHACWWIGAIAVPVNCKLHPREAEWIVENAEASLVFTDKGEILAPRPDRPELALTAACSVRRAGDAAAGSR